MSNFWSDEQHHADEAHQINHAEKLQRVLDATAPGWPTGAITAEEIRNAAVDIQDPNDPAPSEQIVDAIRSRFSILADWEIALVEDPEYHGQASIHPRENRAVIYDWPDPGDRPADFLWHEILHIALRAICRRKGDRRMEAEEGFVQDLCGILRADKEKP